MAARKSATSTATFFDLARSDLAGLAALSIPHSEDDIAAFHAYTAGNLRLAELCIALYQTGEAPSFTAILDHLPQFHGLLPLWLRLERRLPMAERQMLQVLSVFHTPAPADVWLGGSTEEVEALTGLIGRRLVQEDDQGGVALLPALSEVVYAELPVEVQEDGALPDRKHGGYTS